YVTFLLVASGAILPYAYNPNRISNQNPTVEFFFSIDLTVIFGGFVYFSTASADRAMDRIDEKLERLIIEVKKLNIDQSRVNLNIEPVSLTKKDSIELDQEIDKRISLLIKKRLLELADNDNQSSDLNEMILVWTVLRTQEKNRNKKVIEIQSTEKEPL
ncbi:MAG: hypothetical protein ACYDBV_15395, partial [Nitrospiria bacterium]